MASTQPRRTNSARSRYIDNDGLIPAEMLASLNQAASYTERLGIVLGYNYDDYINAVRAELRGLSRDDATIACSLAFEQTVKKFTPPNGDRALTSREAQAALRGWFITNAKWRAREILRGNRQHEHRERAAGDDLPETGLYLAPTAVDDPIEQRVEAQQINEAMRQLALIAPRQRDVLALLMFSGGNTPNQTMIAERLGITKQSVNDLKKRGVASLTKIIAKLNVGGFCAEYDEHRQLILPERVAQQEGMTGPLVDEVGPERAAVIVMHVYGDPDDADDHGCRRCKRAVYTQQRMLATLLPLAITPTISNVLFAGALTTTGTVAVVTGLPIAAKLLLIAASGVLVGGAAVLEGPRLLDAIRGAPPPAQSPAGISGGTIDFGAATQATLATRAGNRPAAARSAPRKSTKKATNTTRRTAATPTPRTAAPTYTPPSPTPTTPARGAAGSAATGSAEAEFSPP